ncbi:MAG: hypothetical protein U0X39_13165 [Bacteroidales bacterium]
MGKTLYKYIAVFAAGLIIILLILRDRSPFGSRNTSFAVKKSAAITRVEFFNGDEKLVLTKTDDKWLVNKSTEARKQPVKALLNVLGSLDIKSPVSDEAFRSEIVDNSISPVRVHVFRGARVIRTFYVYRVGSNKHGNIMKMRPSSKPYIMSATGIDGDIGALFSTDKKFWEPYSVFRLLPGEIRSIEVIYPADSSSSFMLERSGDVFVLQGQNRRIISADSARVRRYVSYFSAVPLESWSHLTSVIDSTTGKVSEPFCEIAVTTNEQLSTRLTIWEKMASRDGITTIDRDRVYARKDTVSRLFVMRYFDLDPLLKKKSYFVGN